MTLAPFVRLPLHAQAPVPREAVECTPRNGLPHFFSKLQQGGNVKIAYLGGSITAQKGWRVKSLAYFQKLFPNAKLEEINAALGGTGSVMGAFRMDHDVLPFKPDLLFIEFSVNDDFADRIEISRGVEGIIRKTWKAYPNCDICIVHTVTDRRFKELEDGKMSAKASVFEGIAEAYGIPTIHMGVEAARLAKEGKLSIKADKAKVEQVAGSGLDQTAGMSLGADGKIPFSRDGVHPYIDTGHQLYLEAIVRSIPKLQAVPAQLEPHTLRAPIEPSNLENAAMLPLDKTNMAGPWKAIDPDSIGIGSKDNHENFGSYVSQFWKGEPGAELTFRFKGSRAGFYDIIGPDCGKIEITVDNKTTQVNRVDGYSNYHRLNSVFIAENLNPSEVHEVKIKVLSDPIDKENIIMPSRRAYYQANPAKFDGLNWYAGALFLVGGIVP